MNEPTLDGDQDPVPATMTAPGESGEREAGSEPVDAAPAEPLPERFRQYRVVRLIGSGATGQVYLAHDPEVDRDVAIKVLTTARPGLYERMLAEARAAAAIEHRNVITIYQVGAFEGRPYIVTEYIRGTSLHAVHTPMPWQRALTIGIDLARGLAAAHRHGVLHRDIKPANAVLTETGQAKLIDFGLAQRVGRAATGEDPIVGTPAFMAPELWDKVPASPRTDIYAMGVLLYQLCTGRTPRPAPSARERPRLEDEVPGIDPRLAGVIHRCLGAPEDRYASGDELCDALEALGEPEGPVLLPDNPYRGLRPFDTAHRGLFFGRRTDMRRVIERMRTQPFVLLAGESGVGKSSLARAGVLPLVEDGALDEQRDHRRHWTVCSRVLGQRPLTTLAYALANAMDAGELRHDIERGDFVAVSRRVGAHLGDRRGMVLLVDQLEELITLAEPGEAERTSELLAGLVAERVPGVRILATARGDYLASLAALPGLGALVERSLCLIRPLRAVAVREVVVKPARAKGVGFESDALVERLVASATSTDGALPLLQFALAQLWDQRDLKKGLITEAAFDDIGGVGGALSRHADGVVDTALPRTRRAMRRILVRLVTTSNTRARLTAVELGIDRDDQQRALDALVAGRLVVAGDLDGEPVYELAHEALITGWPRLQGWLSRASNLRVVRERLTAATREWEKAGRAREYLWGPRQLGAAEGIDRGALPAAERAFLAASGRAVRRGRWERRLAVVAALVFVAGAYGAYWYNTEQEIDEHLGAAERAMTRARDRAHILAARHARVMEELAADRGAEAAVHWQEVLNLLPEVDAAYRRVSRPLELALNLDPQRDSTRALMGVLLDERARLAHLMGRDREREQIVERLSIYDPSAHQRWSAPVPVAIGSRPSTPVAIARYVPRPDGTLDTAPWAGGRTQTTPFQIALPPGSYVLRLRGDADHVEVRYPLVVHPGVAEGEPEIELDIPRPRRDQVPPGFVYVPPGRYLSGYGHNADDEPLRRFYGASPLHERHGHAFLIARHETTYADWMAFADACRPDGCDGRVPSLPAVEPDETSTVALRLRPHPEHGWQLEIEPTRGHAYRAVRGQPLVYQGRRVRRVQRWERFPVSGVSWGDVQIYMQWLRATGRVPGARLCTPREWERAARGADARLFPHGDRMAPDDANFDRTYGQEARAFGPDEVGAHPRSASPFGLQDMAGNVWEFVATPAERGQAPGPRLVQVRGGAYFHNVDASAVVNEWGIMSNQKTSTVGFRVCADAPRL